MMRLMINTSEYRIKVSLGLAKVVCIICAGGAPMATCTAAMASSRLSMAKSDRCRIITQLCQARDMDKANAIFRRAQHHEPFAVTALQ